MDFEISHKELNQLASSFTDESHNEEFFGKFAQQLIGAAKSLIASDVNVFMQNLFDLTEWGYVTRYERDMYMSVQKTLVLNHKA